MNLLPQASGSRPRLAVEISPGGVIGAHSPEPGMPLAAVAKAELQGSALVPGLRPGNIADRVAVVAAVRRVLEQVGGRSGGRNGDLSLVIPDAAVRVLLLDFDSLPSKLSEALPIVRFRLKKLVPFDTDQAMVSFQVMSSSRAMLRVLAVTIPRDVLSEYESVVREAGFEPGAVLPSTLAALAAVQEGEGASLVVNAHAEGVTTAIVRAGILLLHRSVELAEFAAPRQGLLAPAMLRDLSGDGGVGGVELAEVGRTPSARVGERQVAGERSVALDHAAMEQAVQDQDAVTALDPPALVLTREGGRPSPASEQRAPSFDMYATGAEGPPMTRSPYASPDLQQELSAQFGQASFVVPEAEGILPGQNGFADGGRGDRRHEITMDREPPTHTLSQEAQTEEIARAVSVAMAYFEDSLGAVPEVLLSAGPVGAEALQRSLEEQGLAAETGLRVRELIGPETLAPAATTGQVSRAWLAGVTGALRS